MNKLERRLLWWPNLVKQVQKGQMADALDLSPGRALLDVGCGEGEFDYWAKGRTPELRVAAGDVRKPDRRRRFRGRVPYLVFDGHRIPFGPGRFDAVLISEVLTAVTRPEVVVREALRVLRPGGRLVIVNGKGYRTLMDFYESPRVAWLRRLLVRFTRLPGSYVEYHRAYVNRNVAADDESYRERMANVESFLEELVGQQPSAGKVQKRYAFNQLNQALLSVIQIIRASIGLDRPRYNYFLLYPLAALLERLPFGSSDGLSVVLIVEKRGDHARKEAGGKGE